MQTFEVGTPSRECFIDITSEVKRLVHEAGLNEGVATIFVPHTTAGVTINENADPDVCCDVVGYLSELVPRSPKFRHAEGNSDSHIKASLIGPSLQILVSGGRLVLGTWQSIYFTEFDGPRRRKVHLSVSESR